MERRSLIMKRITNVGDTVLGIVLDYIIGTILGLAFGTAMIVLIVYFLTAQ